MMAALIVPVFIGWILDCLLGDPYTWWHPVRVIGQLISGMEKRIRACFRTNLELGGVCMALVVLALTTGSVGLLLWVSYSIHFVLGLVVESICCYYLFAAKCLRDESMKVHDALEKKDTEVARKAVSMIVGRDTSVLDEAGITRAAVETVAENTSDGVTAPMLYMLLGGATAGFFYKAANTMDSMVGYKEEPYREIGHFAAKLDDVLNYIPSRLTALFMVFAAYLLSYDGKHAFQIWRRDRRKHASPNSAQTEAACAGALGLRLAGDAWYFGHLHKKPYIGEEIRQIEAEDIVRANRLMYVTSWMMLVVGIGLRLFFLFLF